MRVLVTGSSGLVGAAALRAIVRAGHEAVPFDLRQGQDILDEQMLGDVARTCDAILHCAALLGREGERPEDIVRANAGGTLVIARVAAAQGIGRIVFLSSVDVLGIFKGERAPTYLPIDGAHPCHARTPYGVAKHLAEEVLRLASRADGITVVRLRPPGVWRRETYDWIVARRAERPAFEWDPFWEYGAFIDVRDLARACVCALEAPLGGFHCVAVASPDITTSGRTSRELASFVHPDVEWCGGPVYDEDPYRSLLDVAPAERLLGFTARHTWRAFVAGRGR